MRGKIGSGKSYAARQICKETGAVLLSVDELMERVFGTECIGREKHVKAENGVLAYYLHLAKELNERGIDTVIDHGFWLIAELDYAKGFLEKNGIDFKVIITEANFTTRLNRVVSRTDGKRFDAEKLKRFDNYYEE